MWIRRVGAEVRNVAYSADGRTVYTVEGGRVTAWDIAARELTHRFSPSDFGFPSYLSDMQAVGNRYVILGAYSRWSACDVVTKKELKGIKIGGYCRPVGPDSTSARFVSSNGKLIRECDLATGKTTTVVRVPDRLKKIDLFAYSPDGQRALLLGRDTRAALVAVETGKAVSAWCPPDYHARHLQFTATGHPVWVAGSGVHVCDPQKRNEPLAHYTIHWPYIFALHPSAPMFAALNGERQLTLFSLDTGAVLRTFDLEIGRRVRCVAFSPDGLTCAVGGSNKQFAVFDVDV